MLLPIDALFYHLSVPVRYVSWVQILLHKCLHIEKWVE